MKKYAEDNIKIEEKLSEQARIIRSLSNEMRKLQEQLRRYRRWNDDKARFLNSVDVSST